ncbi:hypothetical protein L6R53_00235 [Myxococcota bacterium]|nr:hypothetical protein [Myxococcota bacterium]
MQLSALFRAALVGQDLDYLATTDDVAFGLDGEGRIAMFNDASLRFAAAEGGGERALPRLGQGYLAVVPDVLRPFYRDLFQHVRASGVAHSHDYQCSSPTRFRLFRLRVQPLTRDDLLLIHRLVEVREHTMQRPPEPLVIAAYRGEDGLIRQCAHCRCVRRVSSPATWDWVPELLGAPGMDVSFGMCPPCVSSYLRSSRAVSVEG